MEKKGTRKLSAREERLVAELVDIMEEFLMKLLPEDQERRLAAFEAAVARVTARH